MKLVFDHMLTPTGSQVLQMEPKAHMQVVERTIKANLADGVKPFVKIEQTGPDKFKGTVHVFSPNEFDNLIEHLRHMSQVTSPAELNSKIREMYSLLHR